MGNRDELGDIEVQTQRMLDAARARLSELEKERKLLTERIVQLEILLGVRRVDGVKRRAKRISTQRLRDDVIAVLNAAPEQRLRATEVLRLLVDERGYPGTRSMRTRIYTALSGWSDAGEVVRRVDRGVYQLLE